MFRFLVQSFKSLQNIYFIRNAMVVFALTLIRHGETGHNKNHIIQGQLDVPLSEVGLQQAEKVAINLQNQKYTHVYSSDLMRAKQTAEIILQKNKFSPGPIIEDVRLRERKFGVVEGQNFEVLKEAAAAVNKTVSVFTPPGAESIEQVRQRAIEFFEDLCHLYLILATKNQNSDVASSKAVADVVDPFIVGFDCSDSSNLGGVQIQAYACAKRKREDSRSDHENGITENEPVPSDVSCGHSSKISANTDLKGTSASTDSASYATSQPPESCKGLISSMQSTTVSPAININRSKQSDQSRYTAAMLDQVKTDNIAANVASSIVLDDNLIRSHILPPVLEGEDNNCPNVSLSPLREQYLASEKGGSELGHALRQGRLSSCQSNEETDNNSAFSANVLVVAHGGLLREIIRHLVEDLECPVPGGRKQALRISPNAGLSKFTISLNEGDTRPKVICLQIHDKQHLSDSGVNSDGSADTTAL